MPREHLAVHKNTCYSPVADLAPSKQAQSGPAHLDSGQTLLSVALLDADMNIILSRVVFSFSVGERVCSQANHESIKESGVKKWVGATMQAGDERR